MDKANSSRNRTALLTLAILLCALATWHGSRMDWLPYLSSKSLIARLMQDDARGRETAYQEISRRLRSGKVAPADIESLADAAIQAFPFDSPPGTPDWQLRILGQLLSQDSLAPQHARSFFEKIFARDFRLGLSSEGIPIANQALVGVVTPGVVAESITLEFVPSSADSEYLGKRVRLTIIGAVFYGLGVLRAGADTSSGPEEVAIDVGISVKTIGGKDAWAGTAHFVNVPWPPRGQQRTETRFVPPQSVISGNKSTSRAAPPPPR